MLTFFYNGIKDAKGAKLQTVRYSVGGLTSKFPAETITIYAKSYEAFSDKVNEAFTVNNDSYSVVDYIMKDNIRVLPSHPLYAQVRVATDKAKAKLDARYGV